MMVSKMLANRRNMVLIYGIGTRERNATTSNRTLKDQLFVLFEDDQCHVTDFLIRNAVSGSEACHAGASRRPTRTIALEGSIVSGFFVTRLAELVLGGEFEVHVKDTHAPWAIST